MEKSTAVRNAQLDAIETTVGVTPILKLRSGSRPTHCSDADTGTVIATLNLPPDWMAAASGGSKGLLGTWQDTSADNSNAGGGMHWRLYDSGGATCHMQGTVTVTGGGGEIELQNLNINAGQAINITSFSITAAGA